MKARLRATANPIASVNLGERRLNFRRLVTSVVAGRINTGATHLFDYQLTVTFGGDAACQALDPGFGQPCLPVTVAAGQVSVVPNTRDMGGNVIALTGTVAGADFSVTLSGMAATPGIGPATTTLAGTWATPAGEPGDLAVTGTVTGRSLKSEGAPNDCTWAGTFSGRLYARAAE